MQSNLRRPGPKAGIIFFVLLCSYRLMAQQLNPYPVIGAIPLPAGYHRIPAESSSFTSWLRSIPLKKDRTVYLFNGSLKRNQDAQFAVLNVSVGKQDLQQCADAVMRLRAEYLYSIHTYSAIDFYTAQGTRLNFREWIEGQRFHLSGNHLVNYRVAPAARDAAPSDHEVAPPLRAAFDDYLTTVFTWCGTLSLEKQLLPVVPFNRVQAGDVLIKGGSPGHAMLVVDIAEDTPGRRLYLLAQSYMPAQDIHIVNNPTDPAISPWYRSDAAGSFIETPEWTFTINQLRRWPGEVQKF